MKRRRLLLGITATPLALALACSGDSDDESAGTSSTGSPGASSSGSGASAAATSAPQVAGSKTPGVYREAWFGDDPGFLDPQGPDVQQVNGPALRPFYRNIYASLTYLDEKSKIVGDVAESWTVSDDGKTYTFKLRQSAAFPSGKTVTAADLVWSWNRALELKATAALGPLGDVAGAAEKFSGRGELTGARAADEKTFVVKLTNPSPSFPARLTLPVTAPLDRAVVEAGGERWADTKSAGAGPFQLERWEKAKAIVLTPNPNWYKKNTKLSRVEMVIVGDYANRTPAYEKGDIDAFDLPFLADLQRFKADRKIGADVVDLGPPNNTTWGLMMNAKAYEPFGDVRVRQAIAQAVDRKRLLADVYGGARVLSPGVVPPDTPNYRATLKEQPYDPAKAKQLLAEAGFPDGARLPELTIYSFGSQSDDFTLFGQYVQDQLKRNLNMNVKLQGVDNAQFFGGLFQGRWGAFIYFISPGYPDPQGALEESFSSRSRTNVAGYASPQFDGFVGQARGETDQAKRTQLYAQAEQQLIDDVPFLPVWRDPTLALRRPYVSGLQANVVGKMRYDTVEVK